MSTPSNSEPDPTQAIPASGPEATDPTHVLPAADSMEAPDTADTGDAESFAVGDAQDASVAAAGSSSVEDLSAASQSQDPFWTAPVAGVAAAATPLSAGAVGGPVPPVPPAAAGSPAPGFLSRFGAAWRHAWSTTLGKVAIIGASALAVVALLGAIGLAAFAGGRMHDGGRDAWSGACADLQQGQSGRGQGQGPMGPGRGQGRGWQDCSDDEQGPMGQQGRGQRQWGEGQDPKAGDSMGQGGMGQMGPGQMGPGQMGPGQLGEGNPTAPGRAGMNGLLGNVLHGEVVIGGTTPKTVLYQVGQVTEFTAGSSLSVKSSDGFTATYALTADTTGPASGLAKGATVRVLADKDGAKATRIMVVGGATATN